MRTSTSESSPNLNPTLPSSPVILDVILDTTSEGVILVRLDGTIVHWNTAARDIFGYAVGADTPAALEALFQGESLDPWRLAAASRSGAGSTETFQAIGRHKNGHSVQLEVRLAFLTSKESSGTAILGFIRDVSPQRSVEAALQVRLERQAAIAWLGERALGGVDLETLFQETSDMVQRTLQADFVKILENQPGGDAMLLRAGTGWNPGLVGRAKVNAHHGSQAGYTLLSHEPVIVEDLASEDRFHPAQMLTEHGVTSGVSTVIEGESAEIVFGVIGVHTRVRRIFGGEDVDFLKTVAALLSAAIRQKEAASDRAGRLQAEANLKEAEQASWKRIVLLSTANRVALDILASRMGVEALGHIAHAARELTGAQYAALGVAHESQPGLAEFLTSGLSDQEEAVIGDLPRGKGVLGLLLTRERPLRVPRISEHPASVGFPPQHPPMESFLGVPIRLENATVGSLYLTNKRGDEEFSEADEAAIGALADFAAIAIYNLRMLSRQKNLTRSLLTAQEEERRSVAHDLHDGLTQYIMAAHAHSEAFKQLRQAGNETKAWTQLEKSTEYLKQAVTESRRMINNLRLLVLDDLGLAGALEHLLQEEVTRAGWQTTHLETNLDDERFDSSLETAVYRVAQEALTNARRHAHSPTIRLQLSKENSDGANRLKLLVQDQGQGFDLNSGLNSPGHFGLRGLEERVHSLSGRCSIRTSKGDGVQIEATFPL